MKEISSAIKQICEEKALEYDAVIETIESALAAAYRKDFGKKNQNIKVVFDEDDVLASKIYDVKTVVEDLPEEMIIEEEEEIEERKPRKGDEKKAEETAKEEAEFVATAEGEDGEEVRRFNPKTEIQLCDAVLIKRDAQIGDEIKIELEAPAEYGRMAAQTAKQVIIQKLREAEREMVFSEFKDKEGEVVNGVIQRREGRIVLIDLGKSVGVLPPDEQLPGERYEPGERIKVFVKEVALKSRGPEVVLSRTSDRILRQVFMLEIPEIANGLIEIKAVAREAGARSKVAVASDSENVDPIGSCVGQRGARIQTIISELGGEKVDIIEYDEDPRVFISNALSPAKIMRVEISDHDKKAQVFVAEDQLSLAIGKGGQNARLAAKLTGWNVDIMKTGAAKEEKKKEEEPVADSVEEAESQDEVAAESEE